MLFKGQQARYMGAAGAGAATSMAVFTMNSEPMSWPPNIQPLLGASVPFTQASAWLNALYAIQVTFCTAAATWLLLQSMCKS